MKSLLTTTQHWRFNNHPASPKKADKNCTAVIESRFMQQKTRERKRGAMDLVVLKWAFGFLGATTHRNSFQDWKFDASELHTQDPFLQLCHSLINFWLRFFAPKRLHVCSVACQDYFFIFIIPLKNNSRGALQPPSAPAGLFVLLGLTALVLPSGGGERGGVTLLTESQITNICQIDHGDEGRGQRTTLKSGRWIILKKKKRKRQEVRGAQGLPRLLGTDQEKQWGPLVMLWFHVEAQGGRRVQTYRRKR